MPIAINGSGTVTGISVGGLPDGIVDTDMLADGAATSPKRGAGSVLQVQQAVKTDVFSSSSTSFVDVTGLSVNITTTGSNKVLVLAQCTVVGEDAGTGIMLDRDGSEPLKASSEGNRQRFTITGGYGQSGFHYSNGANHISFLDSPGAGTHTYKIKAKTRTSSTFYLNSTTHRNNDTNTSNSTATITVMEIKV